MRSTYKSPLLLHENLIKTGRTLSPGAPAKEAPAKVRTPHTSVPGCRFLAGNVPLWNSHLQADQLSRTRLTKYTLWTLSDITVCPHVSHLCGLWVFLGEMSTPLAAVLLAVPSLLCIPSSGGLQLGAPIPKLVWACGSAWGSWFSAILKQSLIFNVKVNRTSVHP